MIRLLKVFLILILLQVVWNCGQNRKKLSDAKLFSDGFSQTGSIQLFTLLDSFPSLKQSFKSMKVEDFNIRLDTSLKLSAREDVLGVLRMVQRIFLNARPQLQNLLDQTSKIIGRIQRNNPTTYQNLQPLLERIRNYPRPVIRNIIPITTTYLLNEYNTKNSRTIGNQILDFANTLGNQNSKDLLEKYQDLAVKALRTNTNFRQATEDLVNAFLEPAFSGDKKIINSVIDLAYNIGELFYKRAGRSNDTSSETVIKTLMVNLEKNFTIGGSNHQGINSYQDLNSPVIKSAELNNISIDLFVLLRQFIQPAIVPVTKEANVILADKLIQNMSLLSFTSNITGAEESLLDMMNLDSNGRDRRTNTGSNILSALESLFYTLSIVDIFGYNWLAGDGVGFSDRTWLNTANPFTNGQINIGDALWSLQSVMQSGTAVNFNSILTLSKNSGQVFKSNLAGTLIPLTGATQGIDFNTPVLSLLERESIGSTSPIESPNVDPIFRKTVPWVFNWIRRVTYSGYGPYYNKNKKDGNGNFLAPDGTIARFQNLTENNFKPSWKTARYKVCQQKTGPSTNDVGLGGREYPNCSAANPGTDYTIYEISKTNSERAVDSDEEAFYKNFQWLLYEKRFVVIIPARAKLDASLAFEESLFIIAIGNGLKGMMGIKPNCPSGNSASCAGNSNGVWLNNTGINLRNPGVTYLDLNPANFSDKAGDSVLYVQGWGYGAAGNEAFQEAFVLKSNAVWPLLIPNPSQVFGLIPPVISVNFPVLERLGFTNDQEVTPTNTGNFWNKRNRLLPLISALLKTLDDQTDVATNKNAYSLLIDLAKLLSRPYIFKDFDNTEIINPQYPTKPRIVSFRLIDDNPIRNATATRGEYQPTEIVNSPISFLIESQKRFQNGVLNLVAKTDLVTSLLKLVSILGEPSRTIPRNKLINALQRMSTEIKISSDGAILTSQFNFQTWVSEQVTELANYPDTRSTNLRDSSWAGVDDSLAFVRDYFSKTSGYSLVKSLDFILQMVIDLKPSTVEIKSALDLVDSLLSKEANGKYNLTNILTDFVPPILLQMAPNGRNFFGVFYSLAATNGFVNYMENNMSFAPFQIKNLISDTENLLNSNMVRTTENSGNSLLFSAGTLISLFADIYEYGKKMDAVGFPFADGLNVNENTSVWQRLNIILSTK